MTRAAYVRVARVLHWTLSALMILAIGLGLYGDSLPGSAGAAAARATTIYALHKTAGMLALLVALPFAVWLLIAPRRRPAPVTSAGLLWRVSYWGLFAYMLLAPLTGPILHGSGPSWGFAPVLLSLPQRVPLIPDAFAADPAVGAFHRDGWWLFAGLTLVHVILWARRRAARGRPAPPAASVPDWLARLSPALGLALWAAAAAVLWPG